MKKITAYDVRELRDLTDAGIMDCKSALQQAGGDIEGAKAILIQKSKASAQRKSNRLANEGVVVINTWNDKTTMIELACETDFVSRNEDFQDAADQICNALALARDGKVERPLGNVDVQDIVDREIADLIGKMGERIFLKGHVDYEVGPGVDSTGGNSNGGLVTTYVHNKGTMENIGRIGVMLETANILPDLAGRIAMHIASASPIAVDRADIQPDIIEQQRTIIRSSDEVSEKPPEIAEKIIEGKIKRFLKDSCLMEQAFMSPKSSEAKRPIGEVLGEYGQSAGMEMVVRRFVRFEVGQD